MPISAIVCYCGSCKGEQTQDVEVALDHAAKRHNVRFPYELLSSMLAQQQDRGSRISTTTLTSKCLRSEVIKRTEPYVDDPAKLYASFRGTMFHGQLEAHAHPRTIAEARFHVVDAFGMGPLSGSPDLLDPVAGYLYDYKFSKEVPRFDYAWGDHIAQMNVNRWLVDNADYAELNMDWLAGPVYYPFTEAGVKAATEKVLEDHHGTVEDDNGLRANKSKFRPIEWQGLIVVYMDDKGPKPILITESIDVPKKSGPGTRKMRVAAFWDDARCEQYIKENYEEAAYYLRGVGQGEIPPIPKGYEMWAHPLCSFCAVKDRCVEEFVNEQVEVRLTQRRAA